MRFWVALLTTAAAIAQETAPTIRVDVREVLVPVIVTDSKGHHVSGLKASDFHIEEDGAPQAITAFSTDTNPSPTLLSALSDRSAAPHGPAPPSGPGPLPHTFVICLDTLDTAFAHASQAREALAHVFAREKAGGARYSVVSVGRQLQVLETVTADPSAVLARIHNASFQTRLGGGDAAALASELNDLKNSMFDFCRRCAACGAGANSGTCGPEIQDLKARLDGQSERWALLRGQMLAQLKAVVEELAKLPTGRTLVLISDGFALQPARDFYAVAGAFLPAASHFQAPGPHDLEPALQAVIRAAAAGNVRIYSLNSQGLSQPELSAGGSLDASAPSDRSAPSVIRKVPSSNRGGRLLSDMDRAAASVSFQNSSGMEQLARATGGVYLHDSNDLAKQFQSVLADGREYYLLAYTPTNSAQDGAFRTIHVELKDPKLQVRAKAGYWAPKP